LRRIEKAVKKNESTEKKNKYKWFIDDAKILNNEKL
jgi:hypothetical protein